MFISFPLLILLFLRQYHRHQKETLYEISFPQGKVVTSTDHRATLFRKEYQQRQTTSASSLPFQLVHPRMCQHERHAPQGSHHALHRIRTHEYQLFPSQEHSLRTLHSFRVVPHLRSFHPLRSFHQNHSTAQHRNRASSSPEAPSHSEQQDIVLKVFS